MSKAAAPRRKRWPLILAALLLLLVGASWWGDHKLKQHGHPGLRVFAQQWMRNYPKNFAMSPPVIAIKVDVGGMEALESVVERSREAGVIVEEGNDYVPAEFTVGEDHFKGKLRIKGKMTDHVEGRKWSFRVVAKKSGGFLGMKRFSLQHPGTRNYLCDWFFHRLMKGEGIIALRYGFCHVNLNDEDLGVYAYEEHFGPELLENNGRLEGPIVRFDPALFWQHRLDRLQGGPKVDDAYGAYQAAALDAFGTDDLATDPKQRKYFEQALSLIEGFRSGALKASQVFDVDRTARRLAMLDLVGGHHSMDWSDVKFYFDPAAQRLEPISYESFSANATKELAGAYRFTEPVQQSDDLHTAFFKDPSIFAAYVRHLERFSKPAYLDSAFTVLQGALDTASATLYGEFPYKELDRSIYYSNQLAIAKLLGTPKGLHAYANALHGDTLVLALVPTGSLPLHIDGIVLPDGRSIQPLKPSILPCRERGRGGAPMEVSFFVPSATDSLLTAALQLEYRVLGASTQRKADVFPYKLSVSAAQDELLAGLAPNARSFAMLVVDDAVGAITFKPGAWTIDRTLVVPAGYTCIATWPLKLNLLNGAEIISYSPLQWIGSEEERMSITSADSSSFGVHVINAGGNSRLQYVDFTHLTRYKYDQPRSGEFSIHGSDAQLAHCRMNGTGATLLDLSTGMYTLDQCSFSGGSDQLELHFANAEISNTVFFGAKDDALSVEGGTVKLAKGLIKDVAGIGVKGTKQAWITLTDCTLTGVKHGIEGREGTRLAMERGSIAARELSVDAHKREMRYGPVKVELKNVSGIDPASAMRCGEGSSIRIDGKAVGTTKPPTE